MYIIKTPEGIDINVLSIYSSVGTDLQELLIDADTEARHEFAIVNGQMMPYATQTSVMAGEYGLSIQKYGKWTDTLITPSLIQIDVIVFADAKSEWNYLLAKDKSNFFIHRGQFQNK